MPYADHRQELDYQRKSVKNRRVTFFAGKVCATCGGLERLCIVPNIRPDKISWSMSEKTIAAKMEGRTIQCWGCKSRAQAAAKGRLRKHGTLWCYKQGCRCEPCRAAKVVERAAYNGVLAERQRHSPVERDKTGSTPVHPAITDNIPFIATDEELEELSGLLRGDDSMPDAALFTASAERNMGGQGANLESGVTRQVLRPAYKSADRGTTSSGSSKKPASTRNSVTWSDEHNCLMVDGKIPAMPTSSKAKAGHYRAPLEDDVP